MNANDKLKKWINHNYLTKGDRRMITDKTKWNDNDYYGDNFKEIMYDKITEGIDLTKASLKNWFLIINSKNLKEIEEDCRLLRSQLSSYVISVLLLIVRKGRQRCKKMSSITSHMKLKK